MGEIERMVQEAEEYAEEDKLLKDKIEAKNQLENYVYSMKSTIDDEEKVGDKISEEDKETITEALNEANDWLTRTMTPTRMSWRPSSRSSKTCAAPSSPSSPRRAAWVAKTRMMTTSPTSTTSKSTNKTPPSPLPAIRSETR